MRVYGMGHTKGDRMERSTAIGIGASGPMGRVATPPTFRKKFIICRSAFVEKKGLPIYASHKNRRKYFYLRLSNCRKKTPNNRFNKVTDTPGSRGGSTEGRNGVGSGVKLTPAGVKPHGRVWNPGVAASSSTSVVPNTRRSDDGSKTKSTQINQLRKKIII